MVKVDREDVKLVNYRKVSSILQLSHVSLLSSFTVDTKKSLKINSRFSRKGKSIIALGVIFVTLVSLFTVLSFEGNMKANVTTAPYGNNSTSSWPTVSTEPTCSSTPNIGGTTNPSASSPTTPESTVSPISTPATSATPTGTNQKSTPTASQFPLTETDPSVNSSVWKAVALNAWAFFQPGVGVDAKTGLPYAGGTDFKAFADWDLGGYIQAVIDAQEIGIIGTSGTWGSSNRIDMVLTFLENRPLNATTHWPFWAYDATNGQGYEVYSTWASTSVNIADTAKLFVALNNLRIYNSSLTQRIDNIVLDGRSPYASLVLGIENFAGSNSIYYYYCWSGFASFWPTQLGNVPSQIMANIGNTPTITTYNMTLPDTALTCEPLLLSIFELNSNPPELATLTKQVYLAQEAYYDATGKYAAWSEGSSPFNGYVYEWVVGPNGKTWQITGTTQNYFNGMNPVIFAKVSYGFLALYNSTYAENMVAALDKALPAPTNGYCDGMDTRGSLEGGTPSSATNSLILDAALYDLLNN